MTNPTQLPTAMDIAESISEFLDYEFAKYLNNAARTIEAYVLQRNAELVAENERLKQAAALFREASFQSHSSHWDSHGTNGANCPACSKASSLRRQADDLLTKPPKTTSY